MLLAVRTNDVTACCISGNLFFENLTCFIEEGRRSTQITFVYESQTVHVPNVCFQYSNDCRRYTHNSTSQHDKQFDTHPSTQTNFKFQITTQYHLRATDHICRTSSTRILHFQHDENRDSNMLHGLGCSLYLT